ncbi:MHS family MFS transporter [Amycolatopsis acidicola]|uniref:Putative proline/betaine transporter n=1 Tax=Amycolatopsis acidicola TaxID=2596893 RepID=A0A5N0V167_9PSEU|nr:MFS transporter [Amycolatopsis acidicola]KAA9160199.1 MHS family MFS transporter [Amycolatopsis acidicola]
MSEPAPAPIGRAILGSLVGTSLEWYDFFLYGSAAALVFNEVFFPSFDPLTGTLLSFLTFAIGFLARPVGGILAGHYGDRFGRKKILLFTVSLMGGSTVAIGLIPSYAVIGVAAPILLILVRLAQGFALGGEWAGGALMIAERAPSARRGYLTSFVQVGVPIGTLLSTALLYLMSGTLSRDAFVHWGWRVPFLVSVVVVLIGVYIRRRVGESPVFTELKEEAGDSRAPLLTLLKTQPWDVLRVIGIRAGADIVYYLLVTFLLTYVTTTLGLPRGVGLLATLIGAGMQLFTYPAFAALSDRYGRKGVTIFGAAGAIAWMFVFFPLVDTKSTGLIVLAVLGGLFFHSAMYGVQASWICELFDARHRYSGASLGYQLSGIVGGSLAPTIAVALLGISDSTVPVVAYVCAALALVLVTALLTRETQGGSLRETSVAETARSAS